jgi:glycyl-tRNA synthetase
LNTSKRNEISEVVDIELSRDEDSVTSLATAQSSDDSIIALAGINSSVAEQKRGNNQHLRSFEIDYPPRRTSTAGATEEDAKEETYIQTEQPTSRKTTALSRASLFRTKGAGKAGGPDTYQRILRLSPWKDAESPRVAAIATGLAPSGEIVLFRATSTPGTSDIIGRIRLDSDEEAEDVDITGLDDGTFLIAYTNGVDVFTCQVSSSTRSNASPDVYRVYSTPLPEVTLRTRPKFRALRFLSLSTLLLLRNTPDRKGCELVLLDLHQTPFSKTKSSATIIHRKKLRKAIKIGLGLDVCNLGSNVENQEQTIVAVSGSDQSIEILTLEYNPRRRGYGKLRPYTTLVDVHPFSMTKICFSPFTPPQSPVTPETPPQYVKLASVSMGNTVVVHTFPLSPLPPSSRSPRYVLVMPGESDAWTNFTSGMTALLSIFVVCFLLQAFTEIRGVMPPYLGATEWLPPDIRAAIARPYQEPPTNPFTIPSATMSVHSTLSPTVPILHHRSLRDLLRARQAEDTLDSIVDTDLAANIPSSSSPPLPHPSIVVRRNQDTNEIFIETTGSALHHGSDGVLRRWEDLTEHDQSIWKKQLTNAGHWGQDEGEMMLRGVLFGERLD